MTDIAAARCNKVDCQVAVTEKCAEGHHPPRSCPNFVGATELLDEEFDEEQLPDGDSKIDGPPQVALPHGELLSHEDVQRFLLWRPATFISIIGDSFSGKTTLICALYDRLLRGPYADMSFAASRTLVALEKRIHPARVDSGRVVPDTTRTSIADGLRYFHFAVAPIGSPRLRTDLLLSDRAGETYRKARNNTDIVANLSEIPQADKILLLVDGGRVADPVQRASTIQGARQMLRVLVDNGAVGSSSTVQVVTSKVDLITAAQDKNNIADALNGFRERLTADFGPKLEQLTFWDVAARDPKGVFDPAHGLDALIRDWVKPRLQRVLASLPPQELKSEFDRLLVRTPFGDA